MDDDEVICVSEIVFYPQGMLYELIQFIEVNVGKNLRSDIAQRNAARCVCVCVCVLNHSSNSSQ